MLSHRLAIIELVFDTRVMEQGAASRGRRRVASMRAVGFADDDSMPARDLSTGERLPQSEPSGHDAGDEWGSSGLAVVGSDGGRRTASSESSRRPRGPVDLADAARRVAPLTLARSRRLEVDPAMAAVFPEGIQRGTTVGIAGAAALSVALAAAAGPTNAGSWLAVVGCRDLCPAGAEALGVALHRTVVVDEPPKGSWGSVLAALFDAFDVVIVDRSERSSARRAGGSVASSIASRDVGRLAARARERGTVVIDVGGVWPGAPDIGMEVVAQQWSGLGDGHGLLDGRHLRVEVVGRRDAGRPRRVDLALPAPTMSAAYAGADIDALVDAVVETNLAARDVGRSTDGDPDRVSVLRRVV
jgi:hypothetical protein